MESNAEDKVSTPPKVQAPNYSMGYLYALGAVVVAIVLWVIVWKMGFVSALVAFGMAWGVSYLYQLGAKADVDKKAGVVLIIMIVVGLLLAFAAGVVSDAWDVYSKAIPDGSLFDSQFREFLGVALSDSTVISAYARDMAMAVLFGALGSFGIIKDILDKGKQPTSTPSQKA